ncbi:DUF3363 domain-containing protein [Emcibacter nanhaiensis]|uniref:DUF3363 domain-containing protein n=2 Tax=Emcibacter nanhaiensis TaxID=1505037 RepID=A0A501PH83_9PROT|nr:DUF3363 domain-containing protein [Emcibacter nanhaiensis]
MTDDREFLPRPGPPRDRGRSFREKIRGKVRSLSHGLDWPQGQKKKSGFQGDRIGRGHWASKMMTYRNRASGTQPYARRVIIKSRIVRLSGKGFSRASTHLSYIQREGVGRDGLEAGAYDKKRENIELGEFRDRCRGDRHQFRFIVSPEDATRLEDLKPFIRQLMGVMEKDLHTSLDWVAVDHFDTAHPHTHVILRGVDQAGEDLVIARNYMSYGMRRRASELMSLELGPRTELEILQQRRRQIGLERLTDLDRMISRLGKKREDGLVLSEAGGRQKSFLTERLKKLEKLGLAHSLPGNIWRVEDNFTDILKRLGERGDIIKTLHRDMTRSGLSPLEQNVSIFDPARHRDGITGEVSSLGLSEELEDRRYLILDGVDGCRWYVDRGKSVYPTTLRQGMIVTVKPALNNKPDALSEKRSRDLPVHLTIASPVPLEKLVEAEGYGWLDRLLLAKERFPASGRGFGKRVGQMLGARRQWLIQMNFVSESDLEEHPPGDAKKRISRLLTRRELERVAEKISGENGKVWVSQSRASPAKGIYVKRLHLVSGVYAFIEGKDHFSFVPWTPGLEKYRGKEIGRAFGRALSGRQIK